MKPRDLAIVASVVVIGGFAAFDALRNLASDDSITRPPAAPTAPADGAEDTTTRPAVSLSGRLVYTDEVCGVREVDLATRAIVDHAADGTCGLWGPARSGRLAYGVAAPRDAEFVTFRVSDLDARSRDYGSYRARWDSIVWSPDGSAVAWCDSRRRGWELVLANEKPLPLPTCPVAYAASGELAFVRGRSLFVGRRRIVTRAPGSGAISAVSFGNEGSLALVVGDEILRYGSVGDPNPLTRVPIRDAYRGSLVFAPDNCGVLLRSPHTGRPPSVTVFGLGCARRVDRRVVPGNEAAWSPDGAWFAVAEPTGIFFHTPAGATAAEAIPEFANQLLWKEAR